MIKEQGKQFVILPYHLQLGKFNKGNALIVLSFLKFQPHASPGFPPFSALRSQLGLKCGLSQGDSYQFTVNVRFL